MPYTEDELVGIVNMALLWPGAASYDGGDLQQIVWNQRGVLSLDVQVLIPLRRFVARTRQYRFMANEGAFVQTFAKEPTETWHAAIDFATRLPAGKTLASGVLTAIDEATGTDATATVLASGTATIQGTDAVLTPQAGTHAHDYLLTLTATLSPSGTLVERLRMQVREKL